LRPLSGVSVPLASDLAESLRSRCYKSGRRPDISCTNKVMSGAIAAIGTLKDILMSCDCPCGSARAPDMSGCMSRTGKANDYPCSVLVALTRLRMCVRSSIVRRERFRVRNNLLGNAVLACCRERHSFPVGFRQGTLGAFGAVPLPSATPTPRWVRHVTDNGEMPLAGAPGRHCRQPGYGPSWKIPLEDAFPCPRGLIAFSSHRAATRKSISTGRYP
jgi:hypothetical protein